jgi:Golgi phosphoprotein 3 (GPP34)
MYARPLADEFFLVGHDQYTGKAQVSDAVLDTGLAGAMLGELVLLGRLLVSDEMLVTVQDPRPTGDRMIDTTVQEIVQQRDVHAVRQWVEYLRDHARELVGQRLVEAGLVERVQSRGMLKQAVRFPARDPLKAAAPEARLRYMLDHPSSLDEPTALLGSLANAAGLEYVIGGGSNRRIRDELAQMTMLLMPGAKALIVGVESAVAQLALRGRR